MYHEEPYYAVFLRDPDAINVEVAHGPVTTQAPRAGGWFGRRAAPELRLRFTGT
jgi:hypothetical protein